MQSSRQYRISLNILGTILVSFLNPNSFLANKIASSNIFGDSQLDLDVAADSIIFENLRNSGVVHHAASEERPYKIDLCEEGEFIVTFDPLDGSSIIDTNFAIGAIFAIWPKGDLFTMTGRDCIASMTGIFGSRTSMLTYDYN
jgi:sedoheptulose-bisphosphatase